MKTPKQSTKKKHKQLERKANCTSKPFRSKQYVDKKREQRIQEEQRISDGAEQWRIFLEKSGVHSPESMRLDILFLSNGPVPTDKACHEDDDENHQEHIKENRILDDDEI